MVRFLAYDSIKRDKLINAMKGFKILNKLVHLTAILRRVTCSVKIYNDVSESFTTQRGVRQGDALACLLFNLALEKVIQNAGIEKRGTIYHKPIQILAYADDVNVIGRTIRDLKEAFIKLEHEAQKMGLRINERKTKYMEVTAQPTKLYKLVNII
jgi:hypothetical protein